MIVSADLHVHPFRECSKDGGQDRLQDGLSAVRQTLQFARDRKCPWVCLGDVKHLRDRWLLSVLNGLLALFGEYADVPKVLLHGNHDGVGGGKSGLEAFQSLKNVRVVAVPCVTDFPDLGVGKAAYWPHQPMLERLPALLTTAKQAGVRVLFAHAFLSGATVGPEEVRLVKGMTLEQFGLAGKGGRIFQHAFFGDVHKRQNIGPPNGTVTQAFYPGSPYAQNWGEREDERSCLFVDTDRELDWLEVVPVRAPRFRVIDFTGWRSNSILKDFCAGKRFEGLPVIAEVAGDFVRLIVGPWADGKLLERVREASGARDFQVVTRRESSVERRAEIHAGMSQDQILSSYLAARPPQDGLDPKAVLAAGKRLAGEV